MDEVSGFVDLQTSEFEKIVLKSPHPVIVEFGAPWCIPCKRVEPLLIELQEREWGGKVELVKVNVDEAIDLTMQYHVMGVPTVILFVKGEPVAQLSGNQPRKRFVEKFSPFLS
jgi:thioredoxin 1